MLLERRLQRLGGRVGHGFEFSFELGDTQGNPFDYTENDIVTTIGTPDGRNVKVPAFFDGGKTWRVRYTPNITGRHTIASFSRNGKPASGLVVLFPASSAERLIEFATGHEALVPPGTTINQTMPIGENAHIARVQVKDGDYELEIYRRSVPYGTVAEHGLYFVAFSADRTRYDRMLARIFGTSGDGMHDHLTDFSRPVSGAFYFAPSLTRLRELEAADA